MAAAEIMSKIQIVARGEDYLDAVIDSLSDETVERLNKHCDEEDESVPFKPIV